MSRVQGEDPTGACVQGHVPQLARGIKGGSCAIVLSKIDEDEYLIIGCASPNGAGGDVLMELDPEEHPQLPICSTTILYTTYFEIIGKDDFRAKVCPFYKDAVFDILLPAYDEQFEEPFPWENYA